MRLTSSQGPNAAWTFTGSAGTQQGNAPLVVAGDRLIGCANNTVYAVDLFTGAAITNPNGFPYSVQRLDPADTSALPIVSSNGSVFFPAVDANGAYAVRALRLVDGTPSPAWTAPAIGVLLSIAAIDDLILIVQQDASGNTFVSAVSAVDGATAWGPLTVANLTSGAVGYGDHAIYFVAGRQLYAVNTDFGDTRFPKPAKDGAPPAPSYNINQLTTPLVSRGTVVCAGDQVWGFNTKTGAQAWAWQISGDSFNGSMPLALSDDGRLVAAMSDGKVPSILEVATGTCKWSKPVGYAGNPVIAGEQVFITGTGQVTIASFDLESGASINFSLAEAGALSATPPAIGNGHLFVQTDDGYIHAHPYGSQSAAYFDGATSHIDIAADGTQFDFGTGDFTIEAWVRSGEGGEILCGYPTAASGTGFRVNLSVDGRLCFAVLDLQGADQDLARGQPTIATDGFWHHVAVVRRGGAVSFFVDGISSAPASLLIRGGQNIRRNGYALYTTGGARRVGRAQRDVLTQPPAPTPIAIAGNNQLFIGWDRHGVVANAAKPDHFKGLVREVRLWNKAIDAAALQDRMNKVLGPKGAPAGTDPRQKANEPQLLGNWHLDDSYDSDQPVIIENDVLDHEYAAAFHNAGSVISDLDLDMSAFPYPLDELRLQWPYAGFWSVRGEHPLTNAPALSTDAVVCFGTNNSLYGVSRLNGKRKWGYAAPGHSAPLALGKSFYVYTLERGLVAIDASSGAVRDVAAFTALPRASDSGTHFPAPAANGTILAAAAPDGTVIVADPTAVDASAAVQFSTAPAPGDLQFAGGKVYCVAGPTAARKLFTCDTSSAQVSSFPIDSEYFAACGSRVIFVQGNQLVAVDSSRQSNAPGYRAVTTSIAVNRITGFAASENLNLLVVSTSDGKLWGLSLATLAQRWCTAVPDGTADGPNTANGYVNAPTISDTAIFCSSRSGAVAAFDIPSGRLLGLFFEQTAVITPVVVQDGTAFFGCAEAAATVPLDGALHSVVFGATFALRLGVDYADESAPLGYAEINNTQPIMADDSGECCVEAWINVWPGPAKDSKTPYTFTGGEIVSIRPAKSGNFGARLLLDRQGRLRFIGHDTKQLDGSWEGFGTQTLNPAGVCDGQWHHVAASRSGAQDIRIYVDGKAQSLDAVAASPLAPSDLGDQFLARIGAPAYQAQPALANTFRGLIADVRLWRTYLPADQISQRMHTKLRGDEFELGAHWDFTASGVHDASRNGYDGALVPAQGSNGANFSLCSLTFDAPDYPDVTTAAEIATPPPGQESSTFYNLTITCRKADTSPLANAPLQLWYVKHPGEQQPQTISLSITSANPPDGPTLPVDVPPVTFDQEGTSQPGFVVHTDAKGQAVLQVVTHDPNHGPSLDLSAEFMPANERLHVNVLIDNQSLPRAKPPSLTVQTKLIQDYHYSTGSKIDDTRSRETYRALITALNGDGSPRVGELLEICTTDHSTDNVSIEVNGQSYTVTPHNSQSFHTDENGQIAVVLAATDLKAADLSVWAGFMHQNERVTIAMDEDAHGSLANIQGDAMKDPSRLINWKPKPKKQKPTDPDPPDPSTRGALLQGDYQDHSDDIAGAIRHVASSTQASPPPSTHKTVVRAAKATSFLDMRQSVRQPMGDARPVLRTLSHIKRQPTITPEAVLASLLASQPKSDDPNAKAPPPPVGFFFDFGDSGPHPNPRSMSFGYFTAAQAAAHMTPTTSAAAVLHGPLRLGFSLGDLWDDVKDGVESAADDIAAEAKKIAVQITDVVTVAIHYVDEVVNVVITSVADAMEVIGNFLEKIALMIVDMIKFLLFLFDWGAILETHDILRDVALNAIDLVLDGGNIGATLLAGVDDLLSKLPGGDEAEKLFASAAAQTGAQDRVASAPDKSTDYSGATGVSGSMVYSKMKEYRDGVTSPGFATQNADAVLASLAPELLSIVEDIVTGSPGNVGPELMNFVQSAAKQIAAEAKQAVTDALSGAASFLTRDNLAPTIEIPFLSELYKWITGNDLTLLDVACLALAIPVNLVYGVATGGGRFNDDERDLPDRIKSAPTHSTLRANAKPMVLGAAPSAVAELLPFTKGVEVVICVFRIVGGAAGFMLDTAFTASFTEPDNDLREQATMLKNLCEIAATVLTQVSLTPRVNNWLASAGYPVNPEFAQDTAYGTMAAECGFAIIDVLSLIATYHPPQRGYEPSDFDRLKYQALCFKGYIYCPGAAAWKIYNAARLSQHDASPAALAAYWLLQLSDTFQSFSGFDNYLYTQIGAKNNNYNEALYGPSLKRRTVLHALSLATEIAVGAVVLLGD